MKKKIFGIILALLLTMTLFGCELFQNSPSITIKYETNGGSAIADTSVKVSNVSDFKLPANPTKEGYVFESWYLDSSFENKFENINISEGALTLYAKWVEESAPIEDAVINGNGGWGTNPRTVLAQRKDGVVLFLVIDGNGVNKYNWSGRGGVTMNELVEILERYGAYNAVNMDGGASTTLVINNELINHPCGYADWADNQRLLPNAWMFK